MQCRASLRSPLWHPTCELVDVLDESISHGPSREILMIKVTRLQNSLSTHHLLVCKLFIAAPNMSARLPSLKALQAVRSSECMQIGMMQRVQTFSTTACYDLNYNVQHQHDATRYAYVSIT